MRGLLRFLAPLLGIVLAVVGVLVVIEVVTAWVRPDADGGVLLPWPEWGSLLRELSWDENPVPAVAITVGVIGLLLVVVALTARRVDVYFADRDAGWSDMTVTTSPRTLARLVGTRVRAFDDVYSAAVTASRRRVAVSATVGNDAPPQIRQTIVGRVGEVLDELPLRRRPRVAVTVAEREGVA